MSAVGSENPETLPEEMVQEEANAKSLQTSYRGPAQSPPSWRWFSQLKLLDLSSVGVIYILEAGDVLEGRGFNKTPES